MADKTMPIKKKNKDIGTTVRDWLTEKMGNPIMPSKEKNQIEQLERDELMDRQREERSSSKEARINKNWRNTFNG